MRAEDIGHVDDLGAFVIAACVKTCRKAGRAYSENVRADLIKAIRDNRDPRGQLVQTRMLAKVEELIEQHPLPLEVRAP